MFFAKISTCQLISQHSLNALGRNYTSLGLFIGIAVTVLDAQGGFHSVFIANDHSLVGIGLTTGIMYHEVGAFTEVFNFRGTAPGREYTFTATLNYIGQGPANNAINRANFHFTINANGITTVEFDNMTQILCQ